MLTQKALKELLHYCPETGVLTWLVSRSRKAKVGAVAGTRNNLNYLIVGIEGKKYYAHRLAWLYTYGEFPPKGLDHLNRDRADNRISNLRLATGAENNQNLSLASNNTSGHAGVTWHKSAKKWMAHIKVNYRQIYLGIFPAIEEAIAARKAAEPKYHQFQNKVTL